MHKTLPCIDWHKSLIVWILPFGKNITAVHQLTFKGNTTLKIGVILEGVPQSFSGLTCQKHQCLCGCENTCIRSLPLTMAAPIHSGTLSPTLSFPEWGCHWSLACSKVNHSGVQSKASKFLLLAQSSVRLAAKVGPGQEWLGATVHS